MKLRNKLIATIVSICMVLAVVGIGAWASVESFTASITNTVNLEFDNLKGQIAVQAMSGADNLELADEPSMQEVLYDGSNVIYNQISSNATNGTNLYWEGTRFLDNSEDGMQGVDNETEAAVFGYVFQYSPTDACTGMSTITAMITETALPEISGGKLMVKYFATTDMQSCTEIESGVPITPIRDNETLMVIAVCQYYNLDGESITTIESSWDFNVTFTSGRNEITTLPGGAIIDVDPSDGIVLAYNYTSPGESLWEIIEFGEYPQTLKASDVTITSETPDADGYYTGSDGARYAKLTINLDANYEIMEMDAETYASLGMLTAADGTQMAEDGTYYFKVEPIKWRVLKEANGQALIVADNILKGMAYQATYTSDNDGYHTTANGAPAGTYANNYMYSDLRAYLTGDFYNTAFDTTEQAQILTTEVDNSAATTNDASNPYVCANTNDKVFALSYADLINEEYKFSSNTEAPDPAKAWKTTDYAKATVAMTITEELASAEGEEAAALYAPYIGTGAMWSRSPNSSYSHFAFCAFLGGLINRSVSNPFSGCVPALQISRN